MNYKYLKRLYEEQRKQIEKWKNYCLKQEKLIHDILRHLDCNNIYSNYVTDKILAFLDEDIAD